MTIRVVIIHYDRVKLQALKKALEGDKDTSVIGMFRKSKDALEYIIEKDVNLVILSDQLDSQTGYEFIINLMRTQPVACLLLTELGVSAEVDYPRALDYSIVDNYVVEFYNDTIIHPARMMIKIKILSKLNLERFMTQIDQINNFKSVLDTTDPGVVVDLEAGGGETAKMNRLRNQTSMEIIKAQTPAQTSIPGARKHDSVVILGASTGGPRLLVYLVAQLPRDFPPVVIVQHMPKGFVGQFAARMNTNARINVKKAEDGDRVLPGNVYIAPGGYHLEFEKVKSSVTIRITDGPKVNFVKPSVDVTLFSAARVYGNKALSVILTGMGSDGREGSRVIKKVGGTVMALNEADSVIYGMNKAVIDAGLADTISGMDEIVTNIVRYLSK